MVICEHCRDYVEYYTKEKYVNKVVKGVEITPLQTLASCNKCNELVYVPSIEDTNLKEVEKSLKMILTNN